MIKAILQAVNSDISISTGNYNDIYEYTNITIDELKNILVKLINIERLEINLEKETCPANIIIETEIVSYKFIPSGNKKLYCDNTDTDINIKDALSLVSGTLVVGDLIIISNEQKEKTVRYHDIAPTLNNITASKIDTSSNTQQIEQRVWKSKGWQENKITLISFAIIFCIIGFIIIEEDSDLALSMFALMGGLLILLIPNAWLGHTILRLGIDWNTNTLWVDYVNKLYWVLNANQVTHFSIKKYDETTDFKSSL